jgi:hypothetical protein
MNESQLGALSRPSPSLSPRLRVIECDPPANRADGARTTELDGKLLPPVLTLPNDGMWE